MDGRLQQEPPVSFWVNTLVIDWNLEVRYSRRYFDKAPQAARSNERVKRQAKVGLREFHVGAKRAQILDASQCNRHRDEREFETWYLRVGTKIPIILPDLRQILQLISTLNFSLRVLVSSSISLQRPSNHLLKYLTPLSLFISSTSNRYHPISLPFTPMFINPFCHPHMNVTAVRRTKVKAWSV